MCQWCSDTRGRAAAQLSLLEGEPHFCATGESVHTLCSSLSYHGCWPWRFWYLGRLWSWAVLICIFFWNLACGCHDTVWLCLG